MARKKKIPLESVLRPDENIYWQGKPEKLAFILSSLKNDAGELTLRVVFDLILIPVLFLNTTAELNPSIQIFLILLWLFHLRPILEILSKPALKTVEWKNTYYIITDQNIYIQFGVNNTYYRAYPVDRIGTKVFYRKNSIDSTLLVGTIGFSVDDYYEERLTSIKNYEDAFKTLKSFAAAKKEILQAEAQAEQLRQEELLRQQILEQEQAELENQQASYQEMVQEDLEFESYEDYKRRMEEEEEAERRQRELEEAREREHEELLNKYNEYRKRHDLQSRQNDNITPENQESLNDSADDSGIEDGIEIEFPVDTGTKSKINRPPRGKRGKSKKGYKYDVTKAKPNVEYGGVNGPAPKTKPAQADDSSDDLDMSVLWGNIND